MANWKVNLDGADRLAKGYKVHFAGSDRVAKSMFIKVSGAWRHILFLGASNRDYNRFSVSSPLSLVWQADGDVTQAGVSRGSWLTDIGAGYGTGFHVKWNQDGGSTTAGLATGGWFSLSTDRTLGITASAGQNRNAYGTYSVSTDGTDGSIIGVGNWSLEIDRS